jgi:hypothetical protein
VRTTEPLEPESLLEALTALEAAVFVDYAMTADPLPRTAAALRQAREVIHQARVQATRKPIRRLLPLPHFRTKTLSGTVFQAPEEGGTQ